MIKLDTVHKTMPIVPFRLAAERPLPTEVVVTEATLCVPRVQRVYETGLYSFRGYALTSKQTGQINRWRGAPYVSDWNAMAAISSAQGKHLDKITQDWRFHDKHRRQPPPGLYSFPSVYLYEIHSDDGDDGHVDYQLYGFYVTDKPDLTNKQLLDIMYGWERSDDEDDERGT